jgi:hypothetical protein
MKKILLLAMAMALSSCTAFKVDAYKDTLPKVAFDKFFNGDIRGWGILQNRSGRVTRRFDVTMHCSWSGDQGTLKEHFSFYDGQNQERTWKVHRLTDGTFEGTAGDIDGKATGKTSGSAIAWQYTMDVPVDGSTYKINFDDWMFYMNGDVIINRSYLKKFGFTVAELTIFMQKTEK